MSGERASRSAGRDLQRLEPQAPHCPQSQDRRTGRGSRPHHPGLPTLDITPRTGDLGERFRVGGMRSVAGPAGLPRETRKIVSYPLGGSWARRDACPPAAFARIAPESAVEMHANSRHSMAIFPLLTPAGTRGRPTAGSADRAVLYVVRRFPAAIWASGDPPTHCHTMGLARGWLPPPLRTPRCSRSRGGRGWGRRPHSPVSVRRDA